MSITTKHGDAGRTRLIFGQGIGKEHPVIAAVGDADELNAVLGLARIHVKREDIAALIARAQHDLVGIMGLLSAGAENAARYAECGFRDIGPEAVNRLTAEGTALEAEFPGGFRTWSVPGEAGAAGGAWLELARCVCRRAERSTAALAAGGTALDPRISPWLNRLSDVLWLAARCEEKSADAGARWRDDGTCITSCAAHLARPLPRQT